jgi:hypothetical protein
MSMQLARAEVPLSAEQIKTLTTALIAEQQRQAEEEEHMRQDPRGNPADPRHHAQTAEETLKRREENNRRTLAAVTPYVTAAQLGALRKQMEQQTSVFQMALRRQAQSQQAPAQ